MCSMGTEPTLPSIDGCHPCNSAEDRSPFGQHSSGSKCTSLIRQPAASRTKIQITDGQRSSTARARSPTIVRSEAAGSMWWRCRPRRLASPSSNRAQRSRPSTVSSAGRPGTILALSRMGPCTRATSAAWSSASMPLRHASSAPAAVWARPAVALRSTDGVAELGGVTEGGVTDSGASSTADRGPAQLTERRPTNRTLTSTAPVDAAHPPAPCAPRCSARGGRGAAARPERRAFRFVPSCGLRPRGPRWRNR